MNIKTPVIHKKGDAGSRSLWKIFFFFSAMGVSFMTGFMYGTIHNSSCIIVTSSANKDLVTTFNSTIASSKGHAIGGNVVNNEGITTNSVINSNERKTNDDDWEGGDVEDPLGNPNAQQRISYFKEFAKSFHPFTDKIGNGQGNGEGHRYHNMYGNFLLPLAASKPTFKFLEIGMGCDMAYGPGASVQLWKKLFPQADIWEAERNKRCMESAKENNQLEGINALVGDQGDLRVLDSWIEQSGGKFDVIIDDGGHKNCQISHTFEKLWPQLNPGGYYFIEDLHAGHVPKYKDCGDLVMGDVLKDWQQQLIFENKALQPIEYKYPLPKDLIFVHCQAEACVLGKYHSKINDPYMP